MAAGEGVRVAEAPLGPRRLSARPRPAVAALVPQVLEALFTCLRLQEDRWTARPSPLSVRRAESSPDFPEAAPFDGASYGKLFREGLSALGDILEGALRSDTLGALRAAAAADDGSLEIPDELWSGVVIELAAAHRHATISRDHLARAAVPLYLGRVASFGGALAELDPRSADDRLESLCLSFERSRGDLVALWTASPAR